MTVRDHLEKQSLMLIAAAMVGHIGNYAYHVITGRMLSAKEYGLLMALFGIINLFLIPMAAVSLVLARAVAIQIQDHRGGGITDLFRKWALGMALISIGYLLLAWSFAPTLQKAFGFNRLAPVLIAAFILGINLFLTLSGALLQGLQEFKGLALRGSLLFGLRALLVGSCLLLGWRAAGWALLAHVAGMIGALILSLVYVIPKLSESDPTPAPSALPLLRKMLEAAPILFTFSILMTADVILAKRYFDPELAGQFAQAATLGRMILWLPLPIAQVLFPKVVREGNATDSQRHTLFKAMSYTLILIAGTLAVGCFGASYALKIVYGIANPPSEQIAWFRGIAIAMALLGPVYLLLQYELARGKIFRLLPLCLLGPAFPLGVHFFHQSPEVLIRILLLINSGALLSSLWVLRQEMYVTRCRREASPESVLPD